eukprot:sb/3461323/
MSGGVSDRISLARSSKLDEDAYQYSSEDHQYSDDSQIKFSQQSSRASKLEESQTPKAQERVPSSNSRKSSVKDLEKPGSRASTTTSSSHSGRSRKSRTSTAKSSHKSTKSSSPGMFEDAADQLEDWIGDSRGSSRSSKSGKVSGATETAKERILSRKSSATEIAPSPESRKSSVREKTASPKSHKSPTKDSTPSRKSRKSSESGKSSRISRKSTSPSFQSATPTKRDSPKSRKSSASIQKTSVVTTPKQRSSGSDDHGSKLSARKLSAKSGHHYAASHKSATPQGDEQVNLDLRLGSRGSDTLSPMKAMVSPQKPPRGGRSSRHTASRSSVSSTQSSIRAETEYLEEKKYLRKLQGESGTPELARGQSGSATPRPQTGSSTATLTPGRAVKSHHSSDQSSEEEKQYKADKKSPGSMISFRSKSRSKPMSMVGFELDDEVQLGQESSGDDTPVPSVKLARPTSSASNRSRILDAQEFAASAVSKKSSEPKEKDSSSEDGYSDIFSSDEDKKSGKKSGHSRISGKDSPKSSSGSDKSSSPGMFEDALDQLEEMILPSDKSSRASSRSSKSGKSSGGIEKQPHSSGSKTSSDSEAGEGAVISRTSKKSYAKVSSDSDTSSKSGTLSKASSKSPTKSPSRTESSASKKSTGEFESRASGKASSARKAVSKEGYSSDDSLFEAAKSSSSDTSPERPISKAWSKRSSKHSSRHSSRASSKHSSSSSSSSGEEVKAVSRASSGKTSRSSIAAKAALQTKFDSSEGSDGSSSSSGLSIARESSKASSKRPLTKTSSKLSEAASSRSSSKSASSRASSKSESGRASSKSDCSRASSKSESSRGSSKAAISRASSKSESSRASSKSESSRASSSKASSPHYSEFSASIRGSSKSCTPTASRKSSREEERTKSAATATPDFSHLPPITTAPKPPERKKTQVSIKDQPLPSLIQRVPKPPPMSRESTSIRALEILRDQLRAERNKKRPESRASLAPYCATNYVFDLINQEYRTEEGRRLDITSYDPFDDTVQDRLERQSTTLTAASGRSRAPKPIPMTEKIPAFPRLGAVLNVKSTVRGRLAYNGLGNIRDTLRREREKIFESRDQAQYEVVQTTWKRFQLNRLPSSQSTNHVLTGSLILLWQQLWLS